MDGCTVTYLTISYGMDWFFFCICNVINNVAVNDLCTYVLLLPYESTQGWFNGSKIFLVKILRLNN